MPQPVHGFNQLGGVVPQASGMPNGGGMWATQPVIGQMPAQVNTWPQQAPPPAAAAAANPFLVSLSSTGIRTICFV